MIVLKNKNLLTAIMQPCGNGYMIKISNKIKIFDKEQTAKDYIYSLGFNF